MKFFKINWKVDFGTNRRILKGFHCFLVTDKQWDLSNFKYLGWNMVIAEIFLWEYKDWNKVGKTQ